MGDCKENYPTKNELNEMQLKLQIKILNEKYKNHKPIITWHFGLPC